LVGCNDIALLLHNLNNIRQVIFTLRDSAISAGQSRTDNFSPFKKIHNL